VALPFFSLAVFMLVDPHEGDSAAQSLAPGLFFGSVFLLPGLAMFFVGRRARREQEFIDGVTGMIRSHDRFSVGELAAKIGRTELETESLVSRVVADDNGIDLVFHRPTREYIHRGRLAADGRVVDRCSACGAPTSHQVVFPGETVPCTYCNAPLVAP
jgi:hypothetical protein